MLIIRGMIASIVIAGLLLLVLRCSSTGVDSASTDAGTLSAQHTQAATAQMTASLRAQNEALSGGMQGKTEIISSVGPGETWHGTVTVKLGPESFSLDRSGASGMRRYTDLQMKLLGNHWQDRSDGDLFFGSQYRQIGLVIGLRHDPSTDGFLIKEGSFMGGEVVANPHHARFADTR